MKTFEVKKIDGKVEVTIKTPKPTEYHERTVDFDALKNQIIKIDESILKLQTEKTELVAMISDIEKQIK